MKGNKHEEQLRIKAVKRYLNGERPSKIYRSLNRSKSWLYKWISRYMGGEPDWYKDKPRAPRSPHRAVDLETEELIVKTRKRLESTKYAQIGATVISWELTKLNIKPPPIWTINRVLKRNNLIKRRPKGYEPKGKDYPAIKVDRPNKLHQTDLVGPRYINKEKLYSLNTMDIYRHKVKIKSLPYRNAEEIIKALIEVWKSMGIPKYCQFDNQQVFIGSDRRPRWFSRIIKLCLSLGIEPLFIPFREPWRMGELERFNDVWDKCFFRTQHFDSLDQLQEEEKKFEAFHNNNHCYSALKGMTPQAFEDKLNFKPKLLNSDFKEKDIEYKREGRIHLIRFIRSDNILKVLGEKFSIKPECQYEYVKATIHLEEETLLIFLFDELIQEYKYTLPKIK